MQQICYINSTSLVNNSKPKAWHFQQVLILLGLPLSIVHTNIINYHKLQQLITLYKQQISSFWLRSREIPGKVSLVWPDRYFGVGRYRLQYKCPRRVLILHVIAPCVKIAVWPCELEITAIALKYRFKPKLAVRS